MQQSLLLPQLKDYDKAIEFFITKLNQLTPFAFTRFSDGELHMMQNKETQLADDFYITGDIKGRGVYPKEEQKHFIPGEHEHLRKYLVESFQHKQLNYFKGMCTRSDVSQEDFDFQIDLHGGVDHSLTFANTFINNNYPVYLEKIIKEILPHRQIAFVVNEAADLSQLPFTVEKEFRIGNDCMVNNYDTISKVKDFLADKEGWVVLCSAASLSNLITYECFKANDKNTFLDIGSSLNPFMGLNGCLHTRGYLQHHLLGQENRYGTQRDTW